MKDICQEALSHINGPTGNSPIIREYTNIIKTQYMLHDYILNLLKI